MGVRHLGAYLFAYTRGVSVLRTEPQNTIPPLRPDAAPLSVTLHGTAFFPARVTGLRCRTGSDPLSFRVLEATYTRNGTLECPVPAAAIEEVWQAREFGTQETLLVIEVSLNGQQFTNNGVGLIVRAPERLREPNGPNDNPAVTPPFSYTAGGTLLTFRYETAYAPDSPRAACLFRFNSTNNGFVSTLPMPVIGINKNLQEL